MIALLRNPTDDQLNEAFAEKVAGWRMTTGVPFYGTPPNERGQYRVPPFCSDANAVLPWLQKCKGASCMFDSVFEDGIWSVDCTNIESECDYPEWGTSNFCNDASLPRAAVIALLRANGVEVEFI